MNEIPESTQQLSPEKKRALLARLLQKKAQEPQTFPLSSAQQGLWFLHQLAPESAAYNMALVLRFSGLLERDILTRSLQEIVRRHAILRTSFPLMNEQPRQRVLDFLPMPLQDVDLCSVPHTQREAVTRRKIQTEISRKFDVERGPIIRTSLLRLAEDEHILVVVIHHIACDGWSINLFLQELSALYQAFLREQPSPLPELSRQYADYALRQIQWLQDERCAAQIKYWKTQLANLPRLATLPTDRPRSASQTFCGASEGFQLDADLLAGLHDISHEAKASLFMILLAAFALFLARYNAEQEIVIGVPMANRKRQEFAPLIGFLANTVVLRFDLSGNLTFWELLRHVRRVALEGFTYQELPFEKLVEVLHPERHLQASPIFQVMFAFQNTASRSLSLPGLSVELLDIQQQSAKFDLTLDVKESERGVTAKCEYNTDLFDKTTIVRMMRHFQRLLREIVDEPHRTLTAFPLLTKDERRRLLVEWNTTTSASFPNRCVHQLFEIQAARIPETTAVVCEEHTMTYSELDRRANQLANYLAGHGVTKETCVGLCVERSFEMLIGIFGILKAGGVYVPIDPAYPAARQHLMLEDAQAALLLTQQSTADAFQAYAERMLRLDTDWPQVARYPTTAPQRDINMQNGAYIIYTSGSTGSPKGTLIQHNSLINYVSGVIRNYDIGPGDRVLQFASLSFDTAAEEIFPCLLSGATLVLRNDAMLSSARTFLRTCEKWRISVLDLPTAYWHELTRGMGREGLTLPKNIRLTFIGGERALPKVLAQWRQVAGNAGRLVNTYGPTESTIVATTWEIPQNFVQESVLREIPIGRVIQNVQAYILDAAFQPVPIGVAGELHLGGHGLARGYVGHPDVTAQQFVPDPFSDSPGARLYKTGDKARYLPDGNIEFLGRIDQQVKIRGFRVELGEIEAALRAHPLVEEALVVLRERENEHLQTLAYVGISVEPEPDAQALRRFLKERLPEYMLPSQIVCLKEFPRTAGGKIDRHALPAPQSRVSGPNDTHVAPRNRLERDLAALWAEVLGVAQVGIHDNFFDLGGHSLQTIQLISKISSKLHYELSIKEMLSGPTVATLAGKLERHERVEKSMPGRAQVAQQTRIDEDTSPFLTIERRPVLSLFALEKVAPVDAASLSYLIASDFRKQQTVKSWFAGLPVCTRIIDTFLGRTASIVLPRFDTELYTDEAGLIRDMLDALHLAKHLGARTVSLTGLLPSATGYGKTIHAASAQIQGLPALTTGHATTAASVVLTVKKIVEESQRDLTQECVGVLGLGSIGRTSLYLLLNCLPHPREILLCDLYSKLPDLEWVKQELRVNFGFHGSIKIVQTFEKEAVPSALYDATLVLGATNIPDVLDISRLRPGTLIVDDSGPHCFAPRSAFKRLAEQNDILFTEGGVLQSPYNLQETRFLPQEFSQQSKFEELERVFAKNWRHHPLHLTGCIFSGLLSSHFEQLPPTLGNVELETSQQHYTKLEQLEFQAASLHCDNDSISPEQIRAFRHRFGGSFEIQGGGE